MINKEEPEDIWPIGWRHDLCGFYAKPNGVGITLKDGICHVTGVQDFRRGPTEPLHTFLGRVRLAVVEYHRHQLALHRDAQVPYVVQPKTVYEHITDLLEPLGWDHVATGWRKESALGNCWVSYNRVSEDLRLGVGSMVSDPYHLAANATKQEVHDALARVLDLPRYP